MKINRLATIATVFAEEGLGYLTGYDALKSVSGDPIVKTSHDSVAVGPDS